MQETQQTDADDSVTLYVVPNCPLCANARAWLARHQVAYVERDVQNDFGALRAMYRLTRQNLVPVFARDERALVRPTDEQLAEFFVNRES
ncbi:MAG TPA: glutaredoxin family protein [Pyrinomonadaceae bacterium]|nr:glutaredoxin family protein [Pyrinomonadaceae bacterium]